MRKRRKHNELNLNRSSGPSRLLTQVELGQKIKEKQMQEKNKKEAI